MERRNCATGAPGGILICQSPPLTQKPRASHANFLMLRASAVPYPVLAGYSLAVFRDSRKKCACKCDRSASGKAALHSPLGIVHFKFRRTGPLPFFCLNLSTPAHTFLAVPSHIMCWFLVGVSSQQGVNVVRLLLRGSGVLRGALSVSVSPSGRLVSVSIRLPFGFSVSFSQPSSRVSVFCVSHVSRGHAHA